MLSNQIIPFDRNRYFYGKLLTAHDFEVEQRYFNNKRRLINQMMFGSGVICGMDILKVDDTNIVIESGVALDSSGRELVLPQPAVKKLSSLEGFDELDKKTAATGNIKSVYLCVRYNENMEEPVHSISRNELSYQNDGPEYGKIQEDCIFFLTDREPEAYPSQAYDAALTHQMIWDAEGVRISIIVPKYVTAGEEFCLETHINKGACNRSLSLEYNLDLSFITSGDDHRTAVTFTEPPATPQAHYCVRTTLTANSSFPQTGEIKVRDFRLTLGDTLKQSKNTLDCEVSIVQDARKAMNESWRQKSLQQQLSNLSNLYLARIYLVMTPEYYLIDTIEQLPFEQSILTAVQAQGLMLYQSQKRIAPVPDSPPPAPPEPPSEETKTGVVKIQIPPGSKKYTRFYSEEIPHLLGIGTVLINVGLEWKDKILYGDASIFDCGLIWGVEADNEKGCFRIAVKLKRNLPLRELCFHWHASRPTDNMLSQASGFRLDPSVRYVTPSETVRFELYGVQWKRGEISWTVNPKKGAQISDIGVFIAPKEAGIYEICAQSLVDEALRATAFIVVKE